MSPNPLVNIKFDTSIKLCQSAENLSVASLLAVLYATIRCFLALLTCFLGKNRRISTPNRRKFVTINMFANKGLPANS